MTAALYVLRANRIAAQDGRALAIVLRGRWSVTTV